jgi:AraC-like DNA-binding protein
LREIRHFVHRPHAGLRPFVREIVWVSSDNPRAQVLLPETTFTLVLRQSGTASLHGEDLPHAVVSGLQERARVVHHGANSSIIVVRFTEIGAPALLHERADVVFAKTARLNALIPGQTIERVQDQLAAARTIGAQAAVVETFLSERIGARDGRRSGVTAQIAAAAKLMRASGGRSPISAIARRVAMSQSALERHFRMATGATPKMFSRLARLERVCGLWDEGKDLTTIAFEAGYTDQPHLVRDFHLFTGMPPQQFFRAHSPRNLPIFYK